MCQQFHLHLREHGTKPEILQKHQIRIYFSQYFSESTREKQELPIRWKCAPPLQIEGFIHLIAQLWLLVWVRQAHSSLHVVVVTMHEQTLTTCHKTGIGTETMTTFKSTISI